MTLSASHRPTGTARVVLYALLLRLQTMQVPMLVQSSAFLTLPSLSSTFRHHQENSNNQFDLSDLRATETIDDDHGVQASASADNKAMAFLKKIGKVGGEKIDFTNSIGVDEGSGGRKTGTRWGRNSAVRKAESAYQSCVTSGTIDDLSENFPITSSGTEWVGVTDRIMGGTSSGTLVREEDFEGRLSNVLRAKVRLNNECCCFVQMATNFAVNSSGNNTVNASEFLGIELDLFYEGGSEKGAFKVHLKAANCLRQFSSYRAPFELPRGEWTTVRLLWSAFSEYDSGAVAGNTVDPSTLKRIGVVAMGKAMDLTLALSSIRFIRSSQQPLLAI